MSTQLPTDMDRFLAPLERRGSRFYGIVIVTAILAVVGIAAWLIEVTGGHVTNLGNWGTSAGVPWGLDIGAFGWWTGIAIGALLLAAAIRVLRIDSYLGFARVGEFLAPLAFLASFLHILYDLGRPGRVVNTVLYPQLQSPLFWDIVLVGGLVVLSVVFLVVTVREDVSRLVAEGNLDDNGLHGWLAGTPAQRERSAASRWIAGIILAFVPVVGGGLVPWAWSQLGVNMNWFGAVQGPEFLLMSLTSGFAMVLLAAGVLRVVYGWSSVFSDRRLAVLGGVTAGVGFFYLVAALFAIQSGSFAASMAPSNVASAMTAGPLSTMMLLAIAAIAIPAVVLAVQIASDTYNRTATLLSSVVLLVGILGMETVLVVGGLTYPEMLYPVSEYVPSLAEWAHVIGTVSLVVLGFVVLSKLLPLVPVGTVEQAGE
ncbi:NrfD/PsrC family molybdoenzyme membrane anchor subunit [Salinilacihabitans rarus]|uniref:NrfD/PsrC family molybdoenzyme membrane anchor subunit n=1 Tax=Salinilacihabitans rarus TaxID=2961596 RepID=UPI0020C88179|nr:NrfD/PsrC family molybdoenzyme membrane anchor subunit [Salinilacihabitans rarus]